MPFIDEIRILRKKILQICFRHTVFFIHLRTMKIQNKKTIASILFVLISFVSIAQGIGDPPPPTPPPPPGLPIDAGVLAVMLLGIFYGTKKLLRK